MTKDGEMFQITQRGYNAADRIRSEDAAQLERRERRDIRLSALAKEVIEKWNTYGSMAPILDAEQGLQSACGNARHGVMARKSVALMPISA